MKKINSILPYWIFLLLILSSCEDEGTQPENIENPFNEELNWNGFVLQDNKYETPYAFIEIWGESIDNMSANFDIHLTDGNYNSKFRTIQPSEILVYFDINSPDLTSLGEGVYYYEDSEARLPGQISEAFITIINEKKDEYKYPVIDGKVEFKENGGFVMVSYELTTIVRNEGQANASQVIIKGKYTGQVVVIDQSLPNP